MLVSTFRMEDDRTPYVFSMPPHLDNQGDDVAAYVSVRPFGKDSRDASISMSIDEAEELARQLVAVVTDAREGRFSEHGVKVAEDMRLQDLKEAWLVQGIEDLNNGGELICVGALNGFGPPRVGMLEGGPREVQ